MRILTFSLAAAASALAFASPASAQYYPQPQGYGQGHGYGLHNNWGHIRSLQARIDNLQRHIARLDRRDFINEREARRLRSDSRDLEQRLRRVSRNGLSPREHAMVMNRLNRLEARLYRDARDGRRWGRYGYNDERWDRDSNRWNSRDDDRRGRDGRRWNDRDDDDDDRRRRGRGRD